jgi:hypothetical protein
MGLLDQHRLASNADFVGVVTAAVMKAVTDIIAEDPEAPLHTQRVALARSVSREVAGQDDSNWIMRFAWKVAANPTIQATLVVNGNVVIENVVDGDFEFVVASYWNEIASDT